MFVMFRLDLQHYGIQHITKRRYFAPLEEPRHVIDIGTGTGRWTLASVPTMLTLFHELLTGWLIGDG
jgi:ubiquinone/menaquinone biosynthesis C-methylase UbiE